MAYVFRIHNHGKNKSEKPVSAESVKGWTGTQYLDEQYRNAIKVGNEVENIGTSIPSIFARLLLFDTAFGSADYNPADEKLISECLDLLEFLYQHGKDNHLIVKRWDAQSQIHLLKGHSSKKLQRLGTVMEDNLKIIGNPAFIYLFYWKDFPTGKVDEREVLIGATSPLTLVFTSPNWKREMKENGWDAKFNRIKEGVLFDNNTIGLAGRDPEFVQMLLDMSHAYHHDSHGAHIFPMQAKNLYEYVNNYIMVNNITVPPINIMSFTQKYNCISRPTIGDISAGQLPICYKQIMPDNGYMMKPTKQLTQGIKIPLVLDDDNISGVQYVGGREWGNNTVNETDRTKDIYQRELPGGMGIQYPYVAWFDLLEDNILELEYPIKEDKFLISTGKDEKGQDISQKYLLPIKPCFFDFFEMANLSEIARIVPNDDGGVNVTLNIPIQDSNHPIRPITRVYDKSHIHVLKNNQIGFYPFFKVIDQTNLNRYAVVSTGNPELVFYKGNDVVNSSVAQRTNAKGLNVATNYYTVKSAFDYVVVKDGNASGLIVPLMNPIEIGNNPVSFKFAIDFGTSNTMIAYSRGGADPVEFCEESSDYAVYLHKHGSNVLTQLRREFLPTSLEEKDMLKFPIKTTVCEKDKYQATGTDELFGKINIGFNFMNEDVLKAETSCYEYKTDLKWSLESNGGDKEWTARVRHFCMGLLWLIKNKSITSGGDANFTVRLTFPKSMLNTHLFYDSGNTISAGQGTWQWAARELGLMGLTFDDSISESEAPYYKTVTDVCDMLNVDIGGGTTDLFFVVHSATPGYCKYQSVRFAADDLWGKGYGVGRKAGDNGFVKYIQERLAEEKKNIDEIIKTAESSSDVMAVLFNRESQLLTSQKIRSNDNLRSILTLHFTALLYHISRIIKKYNMPIPKKISFSGMGSLYIKLIGKDSKLEQFVINVLTYQTGKEAPVDFKLSFGTVSDAKQNTALGALEHDTVVATAGTFDLSKLKHDEIDEQGIDVEQPLCYQDIFNDKDKSIYSQSNKVFSDFVDYLKSDDYSRNVNNNFGFGIPQSMITAFCNSGGQSYTNVTALLPTNAPAATIRDSLFFWHIKDALYSLAANFYK